MEKPPQTPAIASQAPLTIGQAALLTGLAKPDREPFVMRVSGKSDVHKVANSLFHASGDHPSVVIRTLGAGPTQQAAKAIAIARGRAAVAGIDLICRISMNDEQQEDGSQLTIMCITVTRARL